MDAKQLLRGGIPLACAYIAALVVRYQDCLDPAQWATTVELAGTALTFVGLFYAYGGATDLWSRMGTWLRVFFGRPRHHVIRAGSATITFGFGRGFLSQRMNLDRQQPVQAQLDQIERYLSVTLIGHLKGVDIQIGELHSLIAELQTASEQAAKEALAHIEVKIAELEDRLNQKQGVDLRVAMLGLIVTGVGVALGYRV